ncbi:MAG: MFS transporter [Bacillota bacterium]|nr:MFS transporter [Bacillota bacterium]
MNSAVKLYVNFIKTMKVPLRYYFSAIFFAAFANGTYNVLFRIYMKNLGLDETVIGSVISVLTIGTAIGAFFGAMLTLRLGKKWALISGQALVFVSALLMVNLPIIPVIYLCNLFFGLGFSVINVVNNPIIFQNTSEKERITGFSLGFMINNLAAMSASFLSGNLSTMLTAHYGSIQANRLTLNMFACAFVIAVVLFAKFFSSDDGVRDEDKVEKQDQKHLFSASFRHYKELFRGRTVLYMLQTSCIGFGAGLVVPFFPIYIKHVLEVGDGIVGNIMAATQVGMALGGLMVPLLAKKFGSIKTVIACQLISIPFLLSISMPMTMWTVMISLFMRSALMNMATPVIGSLAMELVDKELQTFMSSLIHLTNSGMRALGAFVGGYMMYNIGYNSPYPLTIAAYLIGTALFYITFQNKTRGQRTGNMS